MQCVKDRLNGERHAVADKSASVEKSGKIVAIRAVALPVVGSSILDCRKHCGGREKEKEKRSKAEKFAVATVADLSSIVETTVMGLKQIWDRLPVVGLTTFQAEKKSSLE